MPRAAEPRRIRGHDGAAVGHSDGKGNAWAVQCIRLWPLLPLSALERRVRAAAACGEVFVLAETGGWRQLGRLCQRLQDKPVPGHVVRVFGGRSCGGLMAVFIAPVPQAP
jgi:hypothetical protein